MNTLIKGTFPVRFRRDGKDGVNVWLKYASVLDLTDSNTGKSYPSKIFNEPTAECKFIGIGKGVGDEPTQGQYYDWKKYIGDDGTSFTPKGRAIAHYTTLTAYNSSSKSVGLYLVDDTAGALLKHWNGSASGDRSVTDGDAYTTADKHLWVKDGAKWNDLGEIKGPKGDPGDDAVSYKLSSSISAIPLDNDAYPTVSSFTLTAYKFVGNSSATFDDSYQLVAIISYSGSTTPITVSTKLGSSSKMTVYLQTGGLSSGSLLKDIKSVTCYLYHGQTNLDSFDILPIKAGAAGVSYFPNMRGYWVAGTYYWTGMSRDMVTYNIGGKPYLFAVKTAGTSTTNCPVKSDGVTTNEGWEKADSPFSMLFANFVYTDNASVAGFIWSADKMKSSSGLLEIDGKNGTIKCSSVELKGTINATGGTIGEFVIRDKGLGLACKADEADILMTCQSNTKRNARIYVTPKYDNAVIYASTDTTTAAHFYAWNSKGTALKVNGKTDISGEVSIIGNTTLSGLVSGLRLDATTMSSGGTIPSNSDIICFTNSSNITVTMPNPVTYEGRILFLKRTGSGGVTLNGSFVRADGTGTATSREHVGNAKSMIYVSNGTFWIEFYCG